MEDKFKKLIGERFRHYKGNEYQLIGYANHSETTEKMVIYQALYDDYKVWVRPFDMFFSKVLLENGVVIDRFSHIKSENKPDEVDDFDYADYEEIKEEERVEKVEKFNEYMRECAKKAKFYTSEMLNKASKFVSEL